MKYAPILIPTLCRDQHFVRLIESLKKNTWAKYTDVYIGLDYPPAPKYEEGYKKICQYLEGDFSDFASFNVIRHSQNVGSLANMESLRAVTLTKYDRYIRTDDDAEFAPNFIEYMDKCLMQYEEDDNVIAVTGYSYPIDWQVSKGASVLKENFICPMWGTGFWRDSYLKIKKEIENGCLKESVPWVLKNNLTKGMLTTCQCEYVDLCLSPIFEKTLAARMTDVATRMYMSIYDKYVIVPIVSKVRNWGFDGSGEYCPKMQTTEKKINARNYNYAEQLLDESYTFDLLPDSLQLTDKNRALLNVFEDVPFKKCLRVNLKIVLCHLLGVKNYKKILLNISKFR